MHEKQQSQVQREKESEIYIYLSIFAEFSLLSLTEIGVFSIVLCFNWALDLELCFHLRVDSWIVACVSRKYTGVVLILAAECKGGPFVAKISRKPHANQDGEYCHEELRNYDKAESNADFERWDEQADAHAVIKDY